MPSYQTTAPPDDVTAELAREVLRDAEQHLEARLASMARDFDERIQQTREYMTRRTRERIKELIAKGEELDLRRKKKQPIVVDWRIPGGEYPPDDLRRQQQQGENDNG